MTAARINPTGHAESAPLNPDAIRHAVRLAASMGFPRATKYATAHITQAKREDTRTYWSEVRASLEQWTPKGEETRG